MKTILLKYKIFILFFLLLISPNPNVLIKILTWPEKSILIINFDQLIKIFFINLFYQLLSIVWLEINKAGIINQRDKKFLSSMPTTLYQSIFLDICILSFINILFFIPLFVTGIYSISHVGKWLSIFCLCKNLIMSLALVLFAQVIFLKTKYKYIFWILILDVLYVANHNYNVYVQMVSFLVIIIVIVLCIRRIYYNNFNSHNLNYLCKGNFLSRFQNFFPYLLKIQYQHLLVTNKIKSLLPFVMITLFLASSLVIAKHIPFVVNILLLINALLLSNYFASLNSQRKVFASFLNSLPFPRWYLFSLDFVFIGFINLMLNIILVFLFAHFIPLGHLVLLVATPNLFLLLIFYPQVSFERYGFLISFLIMLIFCVLEFYFV